MGCFISTNSAAPPLSKTRSVSDQHNGGSKSPPPVDEETVKEVLSETPAIPKRLAPPAAPRFCGSEEMIQRSGGARNSAAAFSNDYPSDVDSEFHGNRSESFSTENDGAFRWRPMLNGRPFSSDSKREKTAGRSPARRSDTSPGRVKSGSGNSRKTGGGDTYRSGSGSYKTGLHASKSTRKAGEHPGRVGCGSGERNRKGEEEERVPPTNSELLESSLVSLECFIFL